MFFPLLAKAKQPKQPTQHTFWPIVHSLLRHLGFLRFSDSNILLLGMARYLCSPGQTTRQMHI
jgi:hypothetical protein